MEKTTNIPGQKPHTIQITNGSEPLKQSTNPQDVTVRSFAMTHEETREYDQRVRAESKGKREAPREIEMPAASSDALVVEIGDLAVARFTGNGYERAFANGDSDYLVTQDGATLRGAAALNALCAAILSSQEETK